MRAQGTNDRPSRYRIEAIALTADDIVRNLGGLLFDRRCLGWDTVVAVDECDDIRPLQIIGVDYADRVSALDRPGHPRAAAIATSVGLYIDDPQVQSRVNAAIASGSTEVVLWGDADTLDSSPQMVAVKRRMSQAAATFKFHAMAAAGVEVPPEIVVEEFLTTSATLQRSQAARHGAGKRPTVKGLSVC